MHFVLFHFCVGLKLLIIDKIWHFIVNSSRLAILKMLSLRQAWSLHCSGRVCFLFLFVLASALWCLGLTNAESSCCQIIKQIYSSKMSCYAWHKQMSRSCHWGHRIRKYFLSLEHQLVLRENSLGYAAAVRIWDRVAKRRLADYQFMNGNLQNM